MQSFIEEQSIYLDDHFDRDKIAANKLNEKITKAFSTSRFIDLKNKLNYIDVFPGCGA